MAKTIAFAALLLAAAACTQNDLQTSAKGAAVGAAVGAGANWVLGGDVADGAAIGAAVGAGTTLIR